jgi:hypothetical protein
MLRNELNRYRSESPFLLSATATAIDMPQFPTILVYKYQTSRILTTVSGLLTSIGKNSREALISKEPTKFVVKISVNLRHISSSEFNGEGE